MLSLRQFDASPNVYEQPKCRLFTLPAELRMCIYEEVFFVPGLSSNGEWTVIRGPANPGILRLLLTCRRILDEAETVYYAYNRLSITHTAVYLRGVFLSDKRREAITKLTMMDTFLDPGFDRVRELFPNITSIWLYCNHDTSLVIGPISEAFDELTQMQKLEDFRILRDYNLGKQAEGHSTIRERWEMVLSEDRQMMDTVKSALDARRGN